jgi:hypothetical protein
MIKKEVMHQKMKVDNMCAAGAMEYEKLQDRMEECR